MAKKKINKTTFSAMIEVEARLDIEIGEFETIEEAIVDAKKKLGRILHDNGIHDWKDEPRVSGVFETYG